MNQKLLNATTNLFNRQIDEIFRTIEKDHYFHKNIKNCNIESYNNKIIKKDIFLYVYLKNFYKKYSLFHYTFFSMFSVLLIVFVSVFMGELNGNKNLDTLPDLVKTPFIVFIVICLLLSIIFIVMAYIKLFSEMYGDAYIHELQVINKRIKSIVFTENLSFFGLYNQILSKSISEVRIISLQTCVSCFELYILIMEGNKKTYEKMSFIVTLIFIFSAYMIYGNFLEIKEVIDLMKFYPLFVVMNSISQGLFYWRCHIRIKSLQQSLFLLKNLQLINVSLSS